MGRGVSEFFLGLLLVFPFGLVTQAGDLESVERVIHKEPTYQSTPRYVLLRIRETPVWLVFDGEDVAYIDRNSNGNLTDAGERVALDFERMKNRSVSGSGRIKGMNSFDLGEVAGEEFTVDLWIPNPDADLEIAEGDDKFERESKAFRGKLKAFNWMNASLLRKAPENVQAQIPIILTTSPQDAMICQILGPLTIQLRDRRETFAQWPMTSSFSVCIGSTNLRPVAWDLPGFEFSPLATSDLPSELHPVLKIYSTAEGEGEKVVKTIPLLQRCCGDSFYDSVSLPKEMNAESIHVSVELKNWLFHRVEPLEADVPVTGYHRLGGAAYLILNDPDISMTQVAGILKTQNRNVFESDEGLMVRIDNEFQCGLTLNRDADVGEMAAKLAEGTKYDGHLSNCKARIEIGPYNEKNAELVESIINQLHQKYGGYVYRGWDKKLIGPKELEL